MKKIILLFVLCLGWSLPSQAGLLFTYHKLALKDLDQMNAMVNDKIKESKKSSSGKIVPLKEAFQAVLARPNEDGMVEKVLPPLRNELENINSYERAIRDLTTEALNALKNTRAFKPDVQVTYAIFLENLMAELKPLIKKDGFEKKTIEKIRDAKIELTKEAKKERQLRLMKSPVSPSEIAEIILNSTKAQEAAAPGEEASAEETSAE